jgi:imidazolonepropionase-like amidohydrolase
VRTIGLLLLLSGALCGRPSRAQDLAVHGSIVHTVSGAPLEDGLVVVRGGKIVAVGPRASTPVPEGLRVLEAQVVTPGLVDAHCCLGLAGELNYAHDREELERSEPMQPELRAIDAYNALDPLVEWVRDLGVTTVHTGHAPGAVISGQTMVVKTSAAGTRVLMPFAMVAATLGDQALAEGEGKSPGTRAKAAALLRQELVRAQAYRAKRAGAEPPDRDLRLEALGAVLAREVPLLVTAHELADLQTALRLAQEFGFRLVLDGASEVYDLLDAVQAAGVPVILHPTMMRAYGVTKNASFETAAKLAAAGIPFAIQGGYESYVPRTRVVLFEAAEAAAHGLAFDASLRAITLDAARILGVAAEVGSLEVGKDGDLALYDADPFEFTSHCTAVVIDGVVVSDTPH